MQRSWQHRAVAGTLVLPFLSRLDAPDMFAKFEVRKKPFQRAGGGVSLSLSPSLPVPLLSIYLCLSRELSLFGFSSAIFRYGRANRLKLQ